MRLLFSILSGSAGASNYPDLYANNIYQTKIVLNWSPGAASYTLQRGTDSNFTNPTTIYSGALTTYEDTGLSPDTTYYYRIKHSTTWNSISASTLPSILAAYLVPGIAYSGTNDYATTSLGVPSVLKSVFGTSGPNLNSTFGTIGREYTQVDDPYCSALFSGGGYADFASDIALGTGAFTIIIDRFSSSSIGGAAQLFSHSTGGEAVRIESNTGCYVRINGSFSTKMTWPSAYTLGTKVTFIIESDGSTVRSSIDGGTTWSNSVTRPGSGGAFNISRCAASSAGANALSFSFNLMAFATTQLTAGQKTKLISWYQGYSFTSTGVDVSKTFKNIPQTFETFASNYLTGFTAGLVAKGHGYGLSKNVFSFGSKSVISAQKKLTSPDYANSYLFIHDSSGVRTGIDLGYYATTEDIHEKPSIVPLNDTIWISQMSQHYGANDGSHYYARKFWQDYDFTDYVTIPKAKGVAATYYLSDTQYHQEAVLGNTIASFSGRRSPTAPIKQGRIMCSLSSDGLQSFYSHYTLVSTSGANDWVYPILIHSGTRSEVYLVVEHVLAGVSPVQCEAISIIKTSDFITWTNIEGTFSKNVVTGGAITNAELLASCAILNATSLTSTLWSHGYCTTGGMLYGVVGNGSNTGWKLYKQSQGQAATLTDITFDGDTVVTGTQTDTTGTYTFAYHRAPIVALYRGGTTWDVIALQVNSGNWTPTRYRSTDDGSTWSKVGILPNIDTTKQHTELEFSQNFHFNNDTGVFTCSRALDASTSNLYIIPISDL